jgi:site-specific recombinase XerD
LISTQKPHKAVSHQTISCWVKHILIKAGINNKYGPHNTRAASTSAARLRGVPLTTIAKTAGWKGAETFAKFYNKTIQEKTVQKAIQTSKK